MSYVNFVQTIITSLDEKLFNDLRDFLVYEFVPLSIAKKEDLTNTVFAEKLCDYFEKIELSTGKKFDKVLEKYCLDLSDIVGSKVADEPKTRKNQPTPPMPRARKYFNRATNIIKDDKSLKPALLDYSRIVLSLYMEIINNNFKEIDNFDLALKNLNLLKIIEAMRNETSTVFKKAKFDTKDPYKSDRSTFVITVMMFYYMKSKEVVGDF